MPLHLLLPPPKSVLATCLPACGCPPLQPRFPKHQADPVLPLYRSSCQDVYLRRISHVLGSRSSAGGQRLAVNFACAGQLDEFRQVERLGGCLGG